MHGNAFAERHNRIEDRTSHCVHTEVRDVRIHITDHTKRVDFPPPTAKPRVRWYDIDEIIEDDEQDTSQPDKSSRAE